VEEGSKAPILDRATLAAKFAQRRIIPADQKELAAYKTVEPVSLDDGSLIKLDGDPNVYLLDHGQRRLIASERMFNYLGYSWANIITINSRHFSLYSQGPIVEDNLPADYGQPIATSTPDSLAPTTTAATTSPTSTNP